MRWFRGRLIWVLLGTVLALLIVAAVAWGLYMMLRQQLQPARAWRNPIAAVSPDGVAPDLALYPLAGAATVETIDASIVGGELETAYALLVHTRELSDAQRLGRLIRLASRFVEAGLSERAELCYQQISDTAILSPELSDSVRADAFLSAGEGRLVLEDTEGALEAYDQAFLLATEGAYLHGAHRRQLLSRLETAYRELDDSEQADECQDLIEELDREPWAYSARPGTEWPSVPGGEDVVSSAEVGTLEEERRQAAYALLQGLSDETEPPSELISRLAQALLQEDAAKLSLYGRELEATTQAGRRIGIQLQLIKWLLLKVQIADGSFGLILVPEWDTQAADIQSALYRAYEDLSIEFDDFVAALPQVSQMDPVRYWMLRRLLLAGRLGHYPDYPAEAMAQDLQATALALIGSGPDGSLFVEPLWNEEGLMFSFRPAEQYGQSTETP